jgi:cyclohexyl-isocyanide hydratase
MASEIQIGILIFPQLTQLDATGPAQILSLLPGARVHMLWKTLEPVATDSGFSIVPTTTLRECPELDVLCVPGGSGQIPLMVDAEVLAFVRRQAATARYVTSVCTGSLVLAAAGVLNGYKSACHWAYRELLRELGAEPVNARVVRDRNRLSGGGVTAGIDFGLTLAAELAGEETAKAIQLAVEYAPAPPFDCGTPEAAGRERVERYRQRAAGLLAERQRLITEIAGRAFP